MNDDSRADFIIIALVVSVLVHAAAMFFMRPQVMTHVSGQSSKSRMHKSYATRERPERDDIVTIETVKDIDALTEAPEAVDDGVLPSVSAMDAFSTPMDIPVPAIPVSSYVPKMTVENAPVLSDKIHVEERPAEYVPPAIEAESAAASARRTEAAPPPPPSPLTAEDLSADIPQVEAPPPAAGPGPEAESAFAALPEEDGPEREAKTFKPVEEVLAELDEKTVEEEKAAVRDLLDVSKARDLDGTVVISAQSAAGKEWTYFRVNVEPDSDLKPVPKDVVILMDASGSISNDRLGSCRAASKEILRSCMNTGDRFNLVAFRDDFQYAFKTWRECDKPSYKAAEDWMDRLAAHGRTDVFATISSVLKLPRDPKRPLIALVVTDGDANSGVRETSQILSRFSELNDGLVSIYMYGVRETANKDLIDVLTHGNRGESFIYSGERKYAGKNIEELSERFRDPVLTDLRIVFTAGSGVEAYPKLLKNLYRGQSVEILGRAPAGTKEIAFSLKGLNGERPYEGFFRISLSAAGFDEGLPKAWRAEQAIDSKLHASGGKAE